MHITFSSLPGKPTSTQLPYPKEFVNSAGLQKRESILHAGKATVRIKELWFEGACLLHTDFKTEKPCSMHLQCDSFCWLISFVLSGEITADFDTERIQMAEGEYNVLYSHVLDAHLMATQHTGAFTICLTRHFVRKLLGKELLPDHFESNENKRLTRVMINEPMDNRLSILIRDMMQAKQPDYIRRIFLESKILEVLCLQLERLESKQTTLNHFSALDIERLNEAKSIIETNMQTPCSLIELARKTGLNDFKLKKGFKYLFNHTVFGYLAEVRMDTAYQLLQQGSSINEVAETVGYKNPHHFSAAFKKKFNVMPKQIAKMTY